MRAYIGIALILLAFMWWGSRHLRTSTHVGDAAYDLLLSTLLSHRVPEISVEQLREHEGHILDARSYREFEVSHISGARWVGYEEFSPDRVAGIDTHASVAVYCAVGYRSERIAERLRAQGYRNVVNVYGGIFEWVNRKYPVVTNDASETERVHAYSRIWSMWLKRGTLVYD